MAEDKNKTDSDRIKELLAQLRATMDLEEEAAATPAEEAAEENREDGYEATLEELLSADALPDEEDEENEENEEEENDGDRVDEDADEALSAGDGDGEIAENAVNGEAEEEPEKTEEEKQSLAPVGKNKIETDVAAALASFVISDEEEDEEDEEEQSFYDLLSELEENALADSVEDDADALRADENDAVEESEEAEDDADGEDDTEIFYTENAADDASFDDKVQLSASTAFALPTAEEAEEEEEDAVVSVGEFSSALRDETAQDEVSEDEISDEESLLDTSFSVTDVTKEFNFEKSVSLPFWERKEEDTPTESETEENADAVACEEADGLSSCEPVEDDLSVCEEHAEENVTAADEVLDETAEATEQGKTPLSVEEAVSDTPEDEPLPCGPLTEGSGPDEEKFDEDESAIADEMPVPDDGGSPPDEWAAPSDVGNAADPLPYRSISEEQENGMAFERVASDESEEEPVPAILPSESVSDDSTSENAETADGQTEEAHTLAAIETESSENESVEENGRHSPRIQLAPLAYRVSKDEEKGQDKNGEEEGENEDYLSGFPGVMRHILEDYKPFGRVNRVQNITTEQKTDETEKKEEKGKPSQKKKRKKLFFAEEEEQEYCDTADADLIRDRLQNDLRNTRARFVVISVFALLLLVLENYAFVPFFAGHSLLSTGKMGYAETFLLFGVALAAAPCLRMGFCGILYRRVLPETILLVQWLLSFVYTLIFSIGELEMPHFSFACALSLGVCLFFRMIERENRITCFRHLTTAGDKLILFPMEKKEIKAEKDILGKSEEDAPLRIYRVRKTPFVDEFSDRTSAICEDSVINLVMLVLFLVAQIASFVVCYVLTKDIIRALSAFAFALAFVPPMTMCAAHIYPMSRALCAAGDDSTILGEDTVNEAVSLDAIAFEDIEALPMKETKMTHLAVSANPTFVFSCLNAIFRTVGGPLAGHFSAADQTKGATKRSVSLMEAVAGGLAATADGVVFHIGDAKYMAQKKVPIASATSSGSVAKNERALYVAMDGRVCAKFHIAYRLSPHFVENVKRLSRLGIKTLVRTYDPCLSDELLLAASVSEFDPASGLEKGQIHVVNKTVGQRADFAAMHAPGGIVTSGHSGKLLQLLFLCFGTRGAVAVGRVAKLVLTVLGAAGAVAMTALGWFDIIPSALVAMYHILWLSLSVVYVKCHIGIPKTTEGKKNESSKNIRHSKGRH